MKPLDLTFEQKNMRSISCSKINITVDRDTIKQLVPSLQALGIGDIHVETGRTVILDEQKGLAKTLFGKQVLREDQSSIVRFCVPSASTQDILRHLTQAHALDQPGTGTITSRTIQLLNTNPQASIFSPKLPEVPKKVLSEHLIGLSCVVQLGEGNSVATIGLNTGTAVPTLTYGIGTGLRNRLGAWRILIPAEKEVVTMILDANDAETVMDMMIEAGSLDQPGKGFIYLYPVDAGVLETRFSIEQNRKAASIEQIISALDELTGTTAWRRKNSSGISGTAGGLHEKRLGTPTTAPDRLAGGRRCLTGLVELTILCNEGMAEDLTKAAMDAGAGGATMRKCRRIDLMTIGGALTIPDPAQLASHASAREISSLTVKEELVQPIVSAIVAAGLFNPQTNGEIHLAPVTKAFTFLGK